MATKRKRLTNTQKVFIGGTILLISGVAYNRYKRKNAVQLPPAPGGQTGATGGANTWGNIFGQAGAGSWGNTFGNIPGLTTTGGSSGSNLPRGLRNNNPLNIIKTSTLWTGEVTPNTDGKFKQFSSIIYGYRAALKNLQAYFQNNWNTIQSITSHWAPAGSGEGNNPGSYGQHVAERTGLPLTSALPFTPEVIVPIVREMAVIENGASYRSMIRDNDIIKAWEML